MLVEIPASSPTGLFTLDADFDRLARSLSVNEGHQAPATCRLTNTLELLGKCHDVPIRRRLPEAGSLILNPASGASAPHGTGASEIGVAPGSRGDANTVRLRKLRPFSVSIRRTGVDRSAHDFPATLSDRARHRGNVGGSRRQHDEASSTREGCRLAGSPHPLFRFPEDLADGLDRSGDSRAAADQIGYCSFGAGGFRPGGAPLLGSCVRRGTP